MTIQSHMYADAQTWNPFKGCRFDCLYCKPSFQMQAKRQKHNCARCYEYTPHCHPERLSKIPSAAIVFVCGNGDISFCEPEYARQIIEAVRGEYERKPDKIFYLQSKRPDYLGQFIAGLPKNVILVTTLETNRDEGYEGISKAPPPSTRYSQFRHLEYPRKVVTIEPVMDFDVDIFTEWIVALKPEYVWLGYNSREKQTRLPEPPEDKLRLFARNLLGNGVVVRGKKLRGMDLPGVNRYQD